jgi:hypothetical protein
LWFVVGEAGTAMAERNPETKMKEREKSLPFEFVVAVSSTITNGFDETARARIATRRADRKLDLRP